MKRDGLYDIHTHILPGIDDGAADFDTALRMLGMEYEEGVRTIVATPHFIPEGKNAAGSEVLRAGQSLKEAAEGRYPGLKLLLGSELYYRDSAAALLKSGEARTIAGTDYVLTEFRTSADYAKIRKALQNLQENGYRPILAHIERYASLADETRLYELREMGAVLQVNTHSFTGGVLDRESRFCLNAAKHGLVDLIASDCHDAVHRAPMMQKAVKRLEGVMGGRQLERLLYHNPTAILENQYL